MSEPAERRSSPLVVQITLFALFLAVTAAGVATVLVPELSDDAGEETDGEGAPDDAPADDARADDAPAEDAP